MTPPDRPEPLSEWTPEQVRKNASDLRQDYRGEPCAQFSPGVLARCATCRHYEATHDDFRRAAMLDAYADLLEARSALTPQGWQPIETAPKDGTEFLAVEAGIDEPIRQVHWSKGSAVAAGGYWVERRYNQIVRPMWWMPQPSPPAQDGGRP